MRLVQRLGKYLRPYLNQFFWALISMALVAGLTALRIYLVKPLQDRVFLAHDMSMLKNLIWWVPVISVLLGFFSYLQNYIMAYIGQQAVTDIRQDLFDHVQDMSMEFFTASSTGKVVALFTNDLTALQQVIARAPIYCIRDGLTAIFNIGLIFYLNWRFALMTLAVLPFSAVIIYVLGKTLRRVGRKGQEQMGELYSVLQENMHAAAVVKAYTAEPMESARFKKANLHWLDLSLHFARADTVSSPLMELVGALILSLLLWKGGADVIHGVWTAGSFVAFITYAVMTYRPLKNFAELNAQYQLGLASSERIFGLLDRKAVVKEAFEARPLGVFSRSIRYENVSFRYAARQGATPESARNGIESPHALQNINFTIRAGEVVALVGPSGAGKSTLALLLPRFYDVSDGAILLDGEDIRKATLSSLRRQIGLVTQEVLLFNETIGYNIGYGKPGATVSEIESAAKAANAHSYIEKLPHGYDTLIGERGTRLSGGERQRLSIARALLKNPPILILDEATSALDAESERLVQEALERLMEHRTALVIAHRLSTVRKADRIVVLDHGGIIEEGTHDSLLQIKGTYAKLHALQVLQ
jgi:ATP-binding cassette, subfamily B, bacterial MsbA